MDLTSQEGVLTNLPYLRTLQTSFRVELLFGCCENSRKISIKDIVVYMGRYDALSHLIIGTIHYQTHGRQKTNSKTIAVRVTSSLCIYGQLN